MSPRTTTAAQLELARGGDAAALSALFERYQRRVFVLVHFKMGERLRAVTDVEDVVQEVYLRAFRDLDHFSYRSPGSFLSWLSRIADRVIVDLVRHESRQKRAGENVRFRSESNPGGSEPVDTRTPSRIFARRQTVERLLERLSALPDDYRDVILMAKVEGLATSEIAERMGKSREAVALLLFRALRRFRALSGRGVE